MYSYYTLQCLSLPDYSCKLCCKPFAAVVSSIYHVGLYIRLADDRRQNRNEWATTGPFEVCHSIDTFSMAIFDRSETVATIPDCIAAHFDGTLLVPVTDSVASLPKRGDRYARDELRSPLPRSAHRTSGVPGRPASLCVQMLSFIHHIARQGGDLVIGALSRSPNSKTMYTRLCTLCTCSTT